MMPLGYFRRRGFSAAGGVAFPFSFALIGSVFWIAQLFQVGMGYSPLASGVRMLVFTMMPMIFAPLAGIGADRVGNRPFMAGGLLLMGGGFLWLALTLRSGSGYSSLVLPFIMAGIGISFVFPTLANAAVGSVPLADSGVAAGANNTMRRGRRPVRRRGPRRCLHRSWRLRLTRGVHARRQVRAHRGGRRRARRGDSGPVRAVSRRRSGRRGGPGHGAGPLVRTGHPEPRRGLAPSGTAARPRSVRQRTLADGAGPRPRRYRARCPRLAKASMNCRIIHRELTTIGTVVA